MGDFRLLDSVRPFRPFLPVIEPAPKLTWASKLGFTAFALAFFLICSQFPLFGVANTTGSDPLYYLRAILASSKGTVMELGVSPIVASGMLLNLFANANIIHVNNSVAEDRRLFIDAQKLMAILWAFGQALALVLVGYYGPISQIGAGNALLIILQLVSCVIMILCWDELLQKGYGYGSAISNFQATNYCSQIIWSAFSPVTATATSTEVEGAIVALVQQLITNKDKLRALHYAIFRQHLPNISSLIATIVIFLVIIYLQGFQVVLGLTAKDTRGQMYHYPIKLFYTTNMPVYLLSTLVSQLSLISQMFYEKFSSNLIVGLLGRWRKDQYGHPVPVGGFIYYITAPSGLSDVMLRPFHALFYFTFFLGGLMWISLEWCKVSGSSADDIAKRIKGAKLELPGHRGKSLEKELKHYISTAAALGAMILGVISLCADMTGAIGSGVGILLAATTMYQLYEDAEKERSAETRKAL